MKKPRGFEIIRDYGEYRPKGRVSWEKGVELVTVAIRYARVAKISNLLVDITGLSGFAYPGLGTRYHMVQVWANASEGFVRIAFVSHPEMIDPQKFGVLVANNAGLTGEVFESEPEALAWLLGKE